LTTSELLRRATVDGIYEGRAVTLQDGVYEDPSADGAARRRVTLLEHLTASGEIDGAAGDEVVAVLAADSGGSGERVYLAVFRPQNGTLANVSTALVGDRVRLRRVGVDAGAIVLDVVQTAPGEPMCCGTQLARRTYRLESGQLKHGTTQVVGRLSLAAISRVEWRLDEVNGKPVADAKQPPTFAVQGDTASGFGGCNRFSGPINESAPGKLSLGDLVATRMACDAPLMSLEDEYLRSLRAVSSYSFLAGRLALAWNAGNERGLLLFRRD
jgi:heat shock protein HslJ